MPKASMDKNYGLILWQDDVRCSGQVPSVKPKAETEAMENSPHKHLWARILASYRPHDLAANRIYHYRNITLVVAARNHR